RQGGDCRAEHRSGQRKISRAVKMPHVTFLPNYWFLIAKSGAERRPAPTSPSRTKRPWRWLQRGSASLLVSAHSREPLPESRPFGQLAGHDGDGAHVDFGLVPLPDDGVVGRARAPALPGLPAVTFQEVGGGGEHVGHAVLEVAPSVAVEIDSILVVARRQELGVADLTGPTAAQLRERQVTALDDAQRVEQVAGEELRAAAVVGQRGQRAHDRELAAAVAAVVGLEAPDCDQDRTRHAELLLDAGERGLVRAHEALPAADQRRADAAGVELLEAQLERALR